MDYFELFNIPKDFNIDIPALKKKYYQLSKMHHPDFHTQSHEENQMENLDKSVAINKGFKVLGDLDSRIKYILELKGSPIEESGNNLPQGFLMEMMDINESLMEAKMSDDQAAIDRAKEGIASFEKALRNEIQETFDAFNFENAEEAQLDALRTYFLKRKYLKRLEQQFSVK